MFAGPGQRFAQINGKGKVTGKCNWVASAAGAVPDALANTLRGDDPGFVDAKTFDFRLRPDSPLIGQGVSQEEYLKTIRLVTANARSGGEAQPSPAWLKALEEIEMPSPAFAPIRKGHGYAPQSAAKPLGLGAYQFAAPGGKIGSGKEQ